MKCVVIMLDTLRPDYLGCYGNDWVKTPNFDKFAQSAMLVEKAYCGSWPTIPNRTDLFTGRFGEPLHPWHPLDWEAITLPEVMRDNGHACQLICDTPHFVNYGFGFDRPFHAWQMIRGKEVDRYRTDDLNLKSMLESDKENFDPRTLPTFHAQYLRNIAPGLGDNEEDYFSPRVMSTVNNWLEGNYTHDDFFLWVDCFDPHEPWDPPKKYLDMYDPDYDHAVPSNFYNVPKMSERDIKNIQARFAAMVTMVDTWIGKVFDKLDELGIADETAVFVMSDHGTGLGQHGTIQKSCPSYEERSRIVWMMRIPGVTTPGARVKGMVQPPDLMPTVLDLAGLECPAETTLQGISLVDLAKGNQDQVRDYALTGPSPLHQGTNVLTLTDGRWCYVNAPTAEAIELFDTDADPMQVNNIADDHPEEVARMRQALLDFLAPLDCPDWVLKGFAECKKQEDPNIPARSKAIYKRMLNPDNFQKYEF